MTAKSPLVGKTSDYTNGNDDNDAPSNSNDTSLSGKQTEDEQNFLRENHVPIIDDNVNGKGNNNNFEIDPAKDLDPYIADRDYAEFVIRTAKKTVKQEDSLVRQIFYTGLSKDSINPINLAVLAPTSEGKTYPVLESLQYFPKEDIWKIGSMSPKVIIRQNGILVDSSNQPLAERIKELKKIKQCKKNGNDSDEKEDLEEQLSQLYQEAKVLIDLRGKLWVFLEPPHSETWTILKPILSHDDFEMEHPYVYEVEGMGFKVKKL